MRAANVLETIGNTPHIRINRLFPGGYEVWSKSERANPGGSIKDRIALSMVEAAERDGRLKPGERSSSRPPQHRHRPGDGGAVKGYPLILVMPDSMSVERRRLMLAYGAKFILTPREKGMKGAIARAQELVTDTPAPGCRSSSTIRPTSMCTCRPPRRRSCATFPKGSTRSSPAWVPAAHLRGRTGAEAEVAGAEGVRGRTGRLAGNLGRPASPHPIQGIGAGFIPHNLKTEVLDGVITVEAEEAREMARRAAREEGLLIGISSGATLAAIAKKLPELKSGSRVLGFNYDTGERYLSTEGFLPTE